MRNSSATFIIYLIGKPGVGKYTIAQEMRLYGYKICDNHLINNPIFSLLSKENFSSIPKLAWQAISEIRQIILKFLGLQTQGNYILTNALYEAVSDHQIFNEVEQMALKRQSIFVPVILSLSQDEHVKRIQNPQRKEMYKSTDIDFVYRSDIIININHPHLLTLDTTNLSPSQTTTVILKHINNISSKNLKTLR